jgi:hypothetical protein
MSASASSALASSLSRAPALSSRAAARGRVVGRAAAAAARRQRHRGRRPSSSSPRLVLRVVSYVQYTLDGPGCAASRSEADWHTSVLLGSHPEGCPPHPVDVTERCEAGDGAFALGNARFEQRGEDLYLSVVDAASEEEEEEGTTIRAESEGAGGEYVAGESKELEREREFDDEREGGVGGGGFFYAGAFFGSSFGFPFFLSPLTSLVVHSRAAVRVDGKAVGRESVKLSPGAIVTLEKPGSETATFEVNRQVHAHA